MFCSNCQLKLKEAMPKTVLSKFILHGIYTVEWKDSNSGNI